VKTKTSKAKKAVEDESAKVKAKASEDDKKAEKSE
jgi:hypothetical protein